MKFWLIIFLFTSDGEFVAKDSYEAVNQEQCTAFAGEVAKTLVNTQLQAQFYCVTDDHYMGRSIDDGVPLD